MFEIYFTRWDNCKMRVRAAEAGCTRITCENEEKYSFTVNVKLIEVKPVESRPWHKYLILCIFPEVCKYLYSISIPSSPALGLSIYCFFRYWRPVLRPVSDLSRMLWVDSGIDACKLTSWIGGTHSASTFKAEFYKITTYFYMKILELSIVSETWSMGHCMGQGTTPHPDTPPTEDFENMFVHERVSDLKSCKMSLIQISPILTRLQLTRVKKCEAAGSYLPSAQSGVHGFTAAGWLLTDSAPATKIKIYYNVKLNLIKCEQRAQTQHQTVCVSCHSSWWIVAATFLM